VYHKTIKIPLKDHKCTEHITKILYIDSYVESNSYSKMSVYYLINQMWDHCPPFCLNMLVKTTESVGDRLWVQITIPNVSQS
jgi:hypothetical protein